MYTIRKAVVADAKQVNLLTKQAFRLYQEELHSGAPVHALTETDIDILDDIMHHTVYVAEEEGKILGAIRYCRLSASVAYIYRFAVEPEINNLGIGSDLLARVVSDCEAANFTAITLHTNTKYYRLARYYYGKQFFVHSTDASKGYIRALFVKELRQDVPYDLSPAFKK
ncbi:MAG: GNAT family N-acetyltransferase, partial [Firmicutes bacterium]|nr:GNAT family N-acetyltransferase [Bacillota bacterium]